MEKVQLFFGGENYNQTVIAIGSSLDPTLVNVFLCHFEEQLMSGYPIDYKLFS